MDIQTRFEHADFIRTEYAEFRDFAEAGMRFLGYELTEVQGDIANFMAHGPRLRMVQAQRGEAKSTLAALYAVWRIIQDPSLPVLIVSGGDTQASEISYLIVRLIMQWDMLAYLRPAQADGDRTSYEKFDVHWALKGLNKSPTVACTGITANIQGKRAGLLIADDVETTKNALTVTQRQLLLQLTKDFSAISTHGDILYLGTPQTKDSIYNTLSRRGFLIRIWPGRYPNDAELERYGDKLAELILERLKADPALRTGHGIDGTRGAPTDPHRYDENALREKELDQGQEGFQLQYMLDTSLSDALRQQLKLVDLVIASFDSDRLPEVIVRQVADRYRVELDEGFCDRTARMYYGTVPDGISFVKRGQTVMQIDPAGGGSDELAYAVTCAVAGYVHVLDVGGWKGGLNDVNTAALIEVIKEFGVTLVRCESNMGHGLFEQNLLGALQTKGNADAAYAFLKKVGVVGEYAKGQKERRIIDSLVGGLQRHRIVLHPRVFETDAQCNQKYEPAKRAERSLFYQLANITTDRDSLPHDDRLDALAAGVKYWGIVFSQDEARAAELRKQQEAQEALRNPMGYTDPGWVGTRQPRKGIRAAIAARRNR
jgi:hypothetical protein